jgi:hypothetical protein
MLAAEGDMENVQGSHQKGEQPSPGRENHSIGVYVLDAQVATLYCLHYYCAIFQRQRLISGNTFHPVHGRGRDQAAKREQ